MFKSTGITGAYEPPYIIILRCECGNSQMVGTDNFEVIKDEYLLLKDDIEITCSECGKIHTDKVICKEQQTFSHINIPKCPTCGSTNISKISTTSKVVGFATVGVFSSNFGKTMHCKQCGYKW